MDKVGQRPINVEALVPVEELGAVGARKVEEDEVEAEAEGEEEEEEEGEEKEEDSDSNMPEPEAKQSFDHPVFQAISLKNGEINRMKTGQLRTELARRALPTHGAKEVLKKRLKTYHRQKLLGKSGVSLDNPTYRFYIVIDFEATCEDKKDNPNFKAEIIEFPAVVVNSSTREICQVFHKYVRPVLNPVLSDYCKNLTGITQELVDAADPFPVVLEQFQIFLETNNLTPLSAMVTDGPYDFGRFFFGQIKWTGLPYPRFAKRWVNIKKAYGNFYHVRKPNIMKMLEHLNLELEGRLHSGVDDAKNLATILIHMLKDGARLELNERIDLSSLSSNTLKPIRSVVKPVTKKKPPQREEQDPVDEAMKVDDCDRGVAGADSHLIVARSAVSKDVQELTNNFIFL